jgi:ribosomal protein S18 acetylase RimI-like enzyme
MVTDSSDSRLIEYRIYTPSDGEAMTRILSEVFCRRDPPAMAVGLTTAEFEDFVRLLWPQVAADGLTIVAELAGTGELVGAMLTEDSAAAVPDGMDKLSAKFNPIFDILGGLDAEYRGGREFRPGEALHLFLLGVSDRVAGRGVGRQLVAACLEHGKRKGYRVAVTEATNKTSQHIFRKLGFVERVKGSYAEHLFEGRRCFASIAEHGGPILMDKEL